MLVMTLLAGSTPPVLGQQPAGAPAAAAGQTDISKEARDSFTRALQEFRAHKLDTAIDEFLRAYAADARILSFNDDGLLDTAVAEMQQRAAATPADLNVNFKAAELTNIKGYSEESLKYYRKVLSLAPQSPQAAIARDEVRKLEAAIQAAKSAATAPTVQGPQSAGSSGVQAPPPRPVPRPPDEALQSKVKELEEEVKKAREESEETKEKLEKLQKEYDELNKKAQKWYFYYTRFFADPRNVQNLQQGQ